MFGIGWAEFILIAVVCLVIIGPKDIPNALYKLGKVVRKFKKMSKSLQDGFDDITKEAELDDIMTQANKIGEGNIDVFLEHQQAREEMQKQIDVDTDIKENPKTKPKKQAEKKPKKKTTGTKAKSKSKAKTPKKKKDKAS